VGTTSRPPKWIKPQLTRLVDEAPAGGGWLHEIKYDGYRMHARLDGGKAALLTRTGLDWSHRYRRTIEALGSLKVTSAYIDGELCALNAEGVPVFSRLQAAMDDGRTDQLVFFAFDLLFLNGMSTAELPLIKRKERLQRLFKKEINGLRYSEHVIGGGPSFRAQACKLGWRAPSQSRPIDLTHPATAASGSSRSASTARSSWSSAGQIPRAADRTSAPCCWATTPTTAACSMPAVPALA
jgi:bifunctional non-homologous end joining protein LigD